MRQPMSSSQLPTPKAKKYDRQLRLWGDHGQQAIEQARVLLIGASAAGTETLKNLVLPGVGSFTIVDHRRVTEEDCGSNFFVELERVGESKAKVCCELLRELNEDVTGDFVEDNAELLLQRDPKFFAAFSLVIAADLPHRPLSRLADLLYERDIPLLLCRQHGLLASYQLVVREHFVWEAHPDNALPDLRLDRPLPDFRAFCDQQDLAGMTHQQHSHTPWLVILYKYLTQWRSANNDKFPTTFAERRAIRELIRSGERATDSKASTDFGDEENWRQAQAAVNTALLPFALSRELVELFRLADVVELTPASPVHWILCKALRQFYDSTGCLPLCGSLPDMVSDSDRYVRLQSIYKRAADADVVRFTSILHGICNSIGRNPDGITQLQVSLFCKNSRFLRLVGTSPYARSYKPDAVSAARRLEEAQETGAQPFWWYVLLCASDGFFADFGRWPGTDSANFLTDLSPLKSKCSELLHDWLPHQQPAGGAAVPEDLVHEVCKFGHAEVHAVAAWMGGVMAQEAIKLLTRQFVPESRVMVYDAIAQSFLPAF